MLAAPLFLGTDIAKLPAASVSLVTNKDLIAIDQDSLGHEAHRVSTTGGVEVWMRSLEDDKFAVALFNTNPKSRTMTESLAAAGIPAGKYSVRDVVNQVSEGTTSTAIGGVALGHGIVVLELTPTD